MHHYWASLAPPRDRNYNFGPKQPSWQMKYHSAVFYLAENQSKSIKCSKPITNTSIWGEVGVQKWCLLIDSGTKSPIFGHQKRALLLKMHIFRDQKGSFWYPYTKMDTTFARQLSPKLSQLNLYERV